MEATVLNKTVLQSPIFFQPENVKTFLTSRERMKVLKKGLYDEKFRIEYETDPRSALETYFPEFKCEKIWEIESFDPEPWACENWVKVLKKAEGNAEFRNFLERDPARAIRECMNLVFDYLYKFPDIENIINLDTYLQNFSCYCSSGIETE